MFNQKDIKTPIKAEIKEGMNIISNLIFKKL
jgi:hypothetical protein